MVNPEQSDYYGQSIVLFYAYVSIDRCSTHALCSKLQYLSWPNGTSVCTISRHISLYVRIHIFVFFRATLVEIRIFSNVFTLSHLCRPPLWL